MNKAKIAIDLVLEHEGGLVDNPQDPGGLTNFGFALREHPEMTADEIRHLTRQQAFDLYRKEYWNHINGDALPVGIGICTMDASVMSGISNGVKFLQRALNITDDGFIGPQTIGAAIQCDHSLTIVSCCDYRLDFLKSLPTWTYFGNGWTNRVTDTRKQALYWSNRR